MRMFQGIYSRPDEKLISKISEMFCQYKAYIALDMLDITQVMNGVENMVFAVGTARGENRIVFALINAVQQAKGFAKDLNLFSAEKVLMYLVFPEEESVQMGELEEVSLFMTKFQSTVSWTWGLASRKSEETNVILIASNLKKQ